MTGVRLEGLAVVSGVVPGDDASVVAVKWPGSYAVNLTYRVSVGRVEGQLLYHDHESRLTIHKASAALRVRR
ncbi:hypothetical protein [Microbispora sp. NBC_01389]|uniref:hypothetical protein n=1 Tax=Microbispora sp. NBC_01389 TaxID=2903584 RepID=UPI00324B9C52